MLGAYRYLILRLWLTIGPAPLIRMIFFINWSVRVVSISRRRILVYLRNCVADSGTGFTRGLARQSLEAAQFRKETER